MVTYNQIIKFFRDFAEAHGQVNEFGNGDLWELIERNKVKGEDFTYPRLFLIDLPFTYNGTVEVMNFSAYIVDQVKKDEGNEDEVKSDMLGILRDLIAELKHQQDFDFNIVETFTATSFTEEFNDELTGWKLDIGLRVPFNRNACIIPKN